MSSLSFILCQPHFDVVTDVLFGQYALHPFFIAASPVSSVSLDVLLLGNDGQAGQAPSRTSARVRAAANAAPVHCSFILFYVFCAHSFLAYTWHWESVIRPSRGQSVTDNERARLESEATRRQRARAPVAYVMGTPSSQSVSRWSNAAPLSISIPAPLRAISSTSQPSWPQVGATSSRGVQ